MCDHSGGQDMTSFLKMSKKRKWDTVQYACIVAKPESSPDILDDIPMSDTERAEKHLQGAVVSYHNELCNVGQDKLRSFDAYKFRVQFKNGQRLMSPQTSLLCQSEKQRCVHYAVHGFQFCMQHILEDSSAPYKQCEFLNNSTKDRCHFCVSLNTQDTRSVSVTVSAICAPLVGHGFSMLDSIV